MANILKFKKTIIAVLSLFVLLGSFFAPIEFSFSTGSFDFSVINARPVNISDYDLGSFWNPFNIMENLARFVYYVFYIPTSLVLWISGFVFDYLLSFSVDSGVLKAPFVASAWAALRNFANMLFILLLVIISISIILDLGKFKSKELVAKVVMVALIINFSLFASRVVIDAGNIVALGFFDAITAEKTTEVVGETPVKNVSKEISKIFNPGKLISPEAFKEWRADEEKNEGAGPALIVAFFMASLMNLYLAYLLFMAGFIFIVRVAWLWVLSAVSPLAFMAFAVPQAEKYWSKWWSDLMNKSFCIVMFLFWIWLSLIILGSNFFGDLFRTQNQGFIGILLIMLLQYMVIITLLRQSLKQTKKMCDDGGLGDKVFGAMKGAVGLAGFATGGAVLGAAAKGLAGTVGRSTFGRGAQKWAKNIEQKGGGTTFAGKLRLKTLRNIGDKKFGLKEGYKTRGERLEKEEHSYASSLPEKVNIYETERNKFGIKQPKTDSQGNKIIKETKRPREEYYSGAEKSPVSGAITAGLGGLSAVSPSLIPATLPIADFIQARRSAGKNAAETKRKLEDAKRELNQLRQQELKEVNISLQEAKDALEKAKKGQPDAVVSNYRTGVVEAQQEVDRVKSEIKEKEEKIKKQKEKMKPSKKK